MAAKRCRKVLVGGWVVLAALVTFTGMVRGWGGSDGSVFPASAGLGWQGDEDILDHPPITFEDCGRCHPGDENLVRHHGLIATAGRTCGECHRIEDAEPGTYRVQVQRECRSCHHLEVHAQVRHRIGGCGPCHPSASGDIIRLHRGKTTGNGSGLDSCTCCHGEQSPAVRETVARGQAGAAVTCRDCHGSTAAAATKGGKKR